MGQHSAANSSSVAGRTSGSGVTQAWAEAPDVLPVEDSFESYAQAALAGLPPDDEAVQLASAAAAAGASLRQLVEFSHAAGAAHDGYAASAVQDPRTGRITAGDAGGGDESLYGDMARWMRPEDLEAWLAERKSRAERGLPPSNWRELKKRKAAVKEKARRQGASWLHD
ncbi:hypothetical protein WJX81_007582 [Elliptochloris bilobata]|uniref:Uncharacterized protein n=1 Tax=Elliptochloris bilobata TaxID=381761 RepID=A0AAW1QU15_9CHLO